MVHGADEKWQLRGRLVIPYLTPAGVVDLKFRLIDGDGPKYLYGQPGTEARLFNTQALLSGADTIYVTEGELDAISLTQAGLQAVGYPGANNWKSHFTRAFYGCADVVVVADGDEAGRNAAGRVAKEISGMAEQVRIVSLADGADCNSILAASGADELVRTVSK